MSRHSKYKRKLTGSIQKNPRGFAFVLSDDNVIEDAYVSPDQACRLLNLDRVEYALERRRGRLSATILKVLERKTSHVLGMIVRARHEAILETESGDFVIQSPSKRSLRNGEWAIGRIEKYPSANRLGSVSLTKRLGKKLLPEHDIDLTVAKFGLRNHFSEAIQKELRGLELKQKEAINTPGKRKDLRSIPFVTIDGEDAKDFDDAVAVLTPKGNSAFVLYVAIADVSFFVRPNSKIDREAQARTTSVYFPGHCLPMLPEKLSNDLCSLRPKQNRLALTAELHLDREGQLIKAAYYESIIRTHARLTYRQLQDYYDKQPKVVEKLKPLAPTLNRLWKAYRQLSKARKVRGTLDFDLPECEMKLNTKAYPTTIRPSERLDTHRLIEEMMITANTAVARSLEKAKFPSVHRVHEPPNPDKMEEINQLLKSLGISQRIESCSSKAFSKLLNSLKGRATEAILNTVILRAQQQARYETKPKGHFGLALKYYTHFTSPIRRYPDLLVHRSLKALRQVKLKPDKKDVEESHLSTLAVQCSQGERTAIDAERYITKRKQCWFMKKRLGQIFSGRVNGLSPQSIYIELPEYAVEGFLPIYELEGYFEFDAKRMRLQKLGSRQFISIGQKLDVLVARVSLSEHQIEFARAQ